MLYTKTAVASRATPIKTRLWALTKSLHGVGVGGSKGHQHQLLWTRGGRGGGRGTGRRVVWKRAIDREQT